MKTKLYAAIIVFFSVFLIIILYLTNISVPASYAETVSIPSFTISQDSGFYDTELLIQISSSPDIDVYYTADCSAPSPGAENTLLYTEPIRIPCTDEITVHTLKFCAYASSFNASADTVNGMISVLSADTETIISDTAFYTCTYIVGSNVSDRFNTLILSISGAEEDLFGYDSGILVSGRLRQEYLDENPDAIPPYYTKPANYYIKGSESERPVTLQVFDPTGQKLLSQNCGIRVQGNYAREQNQKSLQLFARHTYDIYGNFHSDLFPGRYTETDGTLLSRNNRLLLKNSGQDFDHGFIRDTFVQALAYQYGYPMTCFDQAAAVFINGNYTGFYWIREPFSNGYLKNLYGDFPGEFITVRLSECYTNAQPEDDSDKQESLAPYQEEYQNIYDSFKESDFLDNKVFEKFSGLIDVENYLQYYALEIYIGNKDWLFGNVKTYRYVSPDGNYEENSLFDGRYRYLLYDTDYAFHLDNPYSSYTWDQDNIAIILADNASPLWCRLMLRPDCRNLFIRYLCDMMNDSFSAENAERTLLSLHQERFYELSYYLEHSDAPAETVTMDTVNAEIDSILDFVRNRPDAMHTFIQNDFPVSHPYSVSVSVPQSASLSLNSITGVKDGFTGTYYAESGLDLKAVPDMGHTFSHYIINGEIFENPELTLTYEELQRLLQIPSGKEAELNIEIVVTDKEDAVPVISRIHYQNPDELVELYNPCEHPLSLNGLYLSTDNENLKEMKLPSVTLQGGESLVLYGKKSTSKEASGKHRLSLSLKKEETLYFSDRNGTLLQQITIPDIDHPENDYVLDLYTGKFYEEEGVIY